MIGEGEMLSADQENMTTSHVSVCPTVLGILLGMEAPSSRSHTVNLNLQKAHLSLPSTMIDGADLSVHLSAVRLHMPWIASVGSHSARTSQNVLNLVVPF